MVLTEDRLAQAQSYIDAIKAKAADDLAAIAAQAEEAKTRLSGEIADTRGSIEPQTEDTEPAQEPQAFFADDQPTIAVDIPAEAQFTDYDPGAPLAPIEQAQESGASADAATDDEGIPLWEDPS